MFTSNPRTPLALLLLTSLPHTLALTCTWQPQGCYPVSPPPLSISIQPSLTTDTTTTNCLSACSSSSPSNHFTGLTSGFTCLCDTTIQGSPIKVDDSYCNTPCFGNASENCGGEGFVSIYQNICELAPSEETGTDVWSWGLTITGPGASTSTTAGGGGVTTLSVSLPGDPITAFPPGVTTTSTSSAPTPKTTTTAAISTGPEPISVVSEGYGLPLTTGDLPVSHISDDYPRGTGKSTIMTKTFSSTTTYTITSCAPTITSCPYGKLTTEVKTWISTYPTTAAVTTSAEVKVAATTLICETTTYESSLLALASALDEGFSVGVGSTASASVTGTGGGKGSGNVSAKATPSVVAGGELSSGGERVGFGGVVGSAVLGLGIFMVVGVWAL